MRVGDIASNGLVYAIDPAILGETRDKKGFFNENVLKALENILQAQEFDAIPLIPGHKMDVTHLARRRLHQGDEHEVYVLSRSEVECIPRDASILEAIFRVLSNEHHILLLEDENGKISDMLTISMIATPKVKSYLRLKISQLDEDGFNWNSKYLSNPKKPSANKIFEKIEKLADLISEEQNKIRGGVPTDRDVSQLIVEILADLQPLKPFKDNLDSIKLIDEGFFLENTGIPKKRGTAKEIQHEWAGSLIAENDTFSSEHVDLAFELFSIANDWDNLLLRKKDGTFDMLSRSGPKDEIEQSPTISIDENTSHLEIAKILFEKNTPVIVVENEDSKWPGIITIHDFALNPSVQNDALMKFTQIEMACREKLVSAGVQYLILDRSKRRLTCVANFNDIIKKLDELGFLSNRSKNNKKLNNIRFARNKLVHEVIGHEMELFPKYLQFVFLESYINSFDLVNLFQSNINAKNITRHLIALDAFVISSEYSIKRKPPKSIGLLIKEFQSLTVENETLTIMVEKSANKINQALSRITDLGTWNEIMLYYFDEIEIINIVNV